MNEQIQTEEQQVQNKSLLKQLTTLNMALISAAVILIIAIFSLGFMAKQVQRDTDTQYGYQREANESGSPEPIGGQFDVQYMQTAKQQSPASVYSDQQGRRGMAEQFHGPMGY
jgi:hypothetical protein